MRVAIEEARKGWEEGNRGYGAVIVKDNRIVAEAHATVDTDMDITAHAEVNAIRKAIKKLNTLNLNGCTLFATHDPCTICGGAIARANLSKVVIGLSVEDPDAQRPILIPVETATRGSLTSVEVVRGVLAEECRKLSTKRPRRGY